VELRLDVRNEYRAGDIRHCYADVSRARRELGFEPRVSFADGIREFAEWLRGRTAADAVDAATAALTDRGLTI
jgi:dTDP-L-rhamnose 4-epimerase